MRFCTHCGKELADNAVICLNCGCETNFTAKNYTYSTNTVNTVAQQESDNSLALWSMICAIVSFFIGWLALGITAIVLSNLSKKESSERNPMATAGFILGIISTVIYSFVFVFIIALLVSI